MTENRILLFCVIGVILVTDILCDSMGGRAYSRYSSCRPHEVEDDKEMIELMKFAIPAMSMDKAKGYLGTVGILGGQADNSGAAHYAAIAALRVGADTVNIFCKKPSAAAILSQGPEAYVHPLVDTNWQRVYEMITKNDVVVIGPGLEFEQHTINVINALVPICKTRLKPIIFDLNPSFLTQQFVNLLLNYPEPGVILMVNAMEFEKLYPMIKSKNGFSDSHINIDFPRLGPNVYIYRKGCTDMGMSKSPRSSWALSQGGSTRRSSGQGSIIAGAAAVYFHWAMKTIPSNISEQYGEMVHAGVGTYMAAKLMRDCNKHAYLEKGKSALTSDMITRISHILYG